MTSHSSIYSRDTQIVLAVLYVIALQSHQKESIYRSHESLLVSEDDFIPKPNREEALNFISRMSEQLHGYGELKDSALAIVHSRMMEMEKSSQDRFQPEEYYQLACDFGNLSHDVVKFALENLCKTTA